MVTLAIALMDTMDSIAKTVRVQRHFNSDIDLKHSFGHLEVKVLENISHIGSPLF